MRKVPKAESLLGTCVLHKLDKVERETTQAFGWVISGIINTVLSITADGA